MTRLERCLAKLYRYDGVVMSMGENFKLRPPVAKKAYTREEYKRKQHLYYPSLVFPLIEYHLFYNEDTSTLVPKVVYDSFDVPERS